MMGHTIEIHHLYFKKIYCVYILYIYIYRSWFFFGDFGIWKLAPKSCECLKLIFHLNSLGGLIHPQDF